MDTRLRRIRLDGVNIDEDHERRLEQFAERVEKLLLSTGLPVRRAEDAWDDGAFVVEVNTSLLAPGVYVEWFSAAAWHRRLHEHFISGASDHTEVVRYREINEAMDQAIVRVVEAFGLTVHYHEYEDWAGYEVRDPETQ